MILNNKKAPFDSYSITFVDTRANKIEFDILNAERTKVASTFIVANRTDIDFYKEAKIKDIELSAYEYLNELRGDGYKIENDLQNWADDSIVPATKAIRTYIPESVIGDCTLNNDNMKLLIDTIVAESKQPIENDPPVILRVKNGVSDIVNFIYTETFQEQNKALMGDYLHKEVFADGTETVINEAGTIVIEHKRT